MRTLVTGGAGFIGTNLIKRLLKEGHSVVSIDNYSTGKEENHQDGCRYWTYDLTESRNPVLERDEYEIIFHLAALPRIQPSFDNPVSTFNSNVLSTLTILERAKQTMTPVIYASSSSTHGDLYANPYTFTKWQGEELCKLYNLVYNLPIIICRFYNVYGPYQATEGAYCNVLGIFERLYNNNEPLTITGDGEQRRDFTYVDDIVDGLVRCGNIILDDIEYPNIGGSTISGEDFELGTGNNYSINELVDAFGDYPREYVDERPGEIRETLNTDTTAREILGWNPEGDIVKYIKSNIL